jgi:hypothetical protein
MSVGSQFVVLLSVGGTRIFQYLSDLLKGTQNKTKIYSIRLLRSRQYDGSLKFMWLLLCERDVQSLTKKPELAKKES